MISSVVYFHSNDYTPCSSEAMACATKQTWDKKIDGNFTAEKRRYGIAAGAYVEILDIPFINLLGELHHIQKRFSFVSPATTIAQHEDMGEYVTKKL